MPALQEECQPSSSKIPCPSHTECAGMNTCTRLPLHTSATLQTNRTLLSALVVTYDLQQARKRHITACRGRFRGMSNHCPHIL